ncbi:MAG TPA: (d)CMP kinase, partial [Firmicutes bacterium]|nr:(d)CMP kinase [Bacillota bacterium]
LYIDTGAMYRAVTLEAMRQGVDLDCPEALTALAAALDIRLESTSQGLRVYCNGKDVSEAIRDPEVSRNTSPVAETPGVRRRLVELQRAMGRQGGVIMEGRDIGTVVFPDADFKFFLTAKAEERARRRHLELEETGRPQAFESVLRDLEERDRRDSTRSVSPLRRAPKAIEVDTTVLTLDQVIEKIAGIVEGRAE